MVDSLLNKEVKNNNYINIDYSINQDDLFLVGDSELDKKGLIHHHLTSANELYEIGIPQIITQVFEINLRLDDIRRTSEEEKNIDHVLIHINFSNVLISSPTMLNYNSGKEEILFPNMALLKEKTYKSNLRVDVNIKATAVMKNGAEVTREETVKNFKICKIPIMVKSKWCNTYNLTKEALVNLNEDPSDPGGYFIIKGVEWVIDCVENILFNKVRIFKNEGYKKEIMRAEFISKPGDFYLNSDQFIIRWLNDGQITIEIKREKLKELYIPFYLLFRVMGWNNDKQIYDNLLFNDSPTSNNIKTFLSDAFNAKYTHFTKSRYIYSQGESLQYMAEEIKDASFSYLDVDKYPENYQKITNFILEHIDIHFLQHLGTDIHARDKKLRFLCLLLRKMFLVNLGNIEPTDRDSYNSKRIHTAGTNYAKSFKTYFNASVIQQIRRKITKDFKSLSFNQIDLNAMIKSSVYGAEFERSITQAITAGNKSQITVSKKIRINRLSSQLLNRKNQLNTYSTLRQVTATSTDSAKQSERANEMRRVHMSFLGYICITHSPEGEKVGINKQLALFATITKASSNEIIKNILSEDNEIFQLNTIDYKDIVDKNLCNIYVNGDWIGCCKDALNIVNKYRKKRRNLEISPEISIVWDNTEDEAYFWTDVGRVIRPLLIVYNNIRDPDFFNESIRKKPFTQCLAITQNHIDKLYSKEIDIEYLLKEKIVEYISAEEQENMFLAYDFNFLRENKNNELLEFTHCDIPQAMFGITALTSPYASHNQAQRIVYQTSQSKQTCGVFAKNWPYRADKDTFLQYNNETPIIKTISNRYLYPNGSNCIVALMCNTGFNQEDSLIINKGAIDKGLFNGCKFTFYKTELEKKEEFANPDNTNTLDIKSASYNHLENGIIKKGTIIHKNDAIIGKILKITKNIDDVYQYTDRSIIYKEDEPAIVHNVIIDRNEEDEQFCKVVLRKLRPVTNGDKFSVIPTSQVLTSNGWKEIQNLDITKDKVATLTLDNQLDYQYPSAISKYKYNGLMYDLTSDDLNIFVTLNHKLYVRDIEEKDFNLYETNKIFNKLVCFKKWAKNRKPDISKFKLNNQKYYNITDWLKFVSIFIIYGTIDDKSLKFNIAILKYNKKLYILTELLMKMNIHFVTTKNYIYINKNKYNFIYDHFQKFINKNERKLPDYIWDYNYRLSRTFINNMLEIYNTIKTKSLQLANELVRLCLHCEWSAVIEFNKYENIYLVIINKFNNEPSINNYKNLLNPNNFNQKEQYTHYYGDVYCLEIPDTHQHVYYSRETTFSNPYWTGNSARSGQKGTIGLLLDEADMPRTEEGVAPTIIMNPHGLPSRMTIGQLIESLVGNLCAEKCVQTDATIFRKVDIETVSNELENLGLNRYGYKRLFNGITGEYIDTEIFIGPTFYQRLQKFTIDTQYSVSTAPSDCITFQPLDGKSSGGGLRIGEMERDTLVSHGGARFITEKFFDHSDGFTEYVCRCGKSAVVNTNKDIYRCSYCKDNAEIIAYPTSWSSKLFIQELETMNVGIKRLPQAYAYDTINDEIFDEIDAIKNQI